jgi:hypothetical protein
MSLFLWSQIIVSCAFVIGIISFQFREKNNVMIAWFVILFLIGIHYILLESYEAGVLSLLSSFRFLVSIFTRKISIMYGFMLLSCIGFIWTYQSPLSFLVLVAVLLSAYTSFLSDDQEFRILMMVIGTMWVAYNIIIGSPVGALMEISFIVSNCIAYYRLYIKKNT